MSVLGRCDGERIPNHPAWCWFKNNESSEFIALVGDSHAISLSAGVLAAAEEIGINLLVMGEVACQINETVDDLTCQDQNRARMEYLIKNKPSAVLLADRYFDSQPWAEGLAPVVNRLTLNELHVIIFGPIPTASFEPGVSWIKPNPKTEKSSLDEQTYIQDSLNQLRALVTDKSKVEFIDVSMVLCKNQLCDPYEDQTLSYFDDNHLNEAGSLRLKDEVIKTLLG
jgi:hypothetical protein